MSRDHRCERISERRNKQFLKALAEERARQVLIEDEAGDAGEREDANVRPHVGQEARMGEEIVL